MASPSPPTSIGGEYQLGAGLVGKAAAVRGAEFLDSISESTWALDTGIGELPAATVFAIPLMFRDQLLGCLAGASAVSLSERERSWLGQIADQMAIGLRSIQQLSQLKALSAELSDRSRRIEMQNAELAESSRLKSDFLSSMSHELRTPLNAIIGFSEVLKDGLLGELPPEQLDYTTEIYDAGKHLLSLINDILDLSKIEAGKMDLDVEPVELGPLVENSIMATLAAQGLTPGLLVVVITAHDDRSLRRRALEDGAIDFITKPVDRVELLAKCKTMLELCRLRQVVEERNFLNHERFEAVAEYSPSAISVRDLEHRFTMVNDAFCQLFGATSVGDVIGRTEDEILPPDVLERSRLGAYRLLAGESFVEEEFITVAQQAVSVMTQRFPLRNSLGAITELVSIRTDITHRKKIEQQAAERALWAERISAAIADGRLLVYSQPIVDIATREVVDEELLVRLREPETGQILPPSEFLPQCEQHELMPVIDRYMVGRAIDLAATGRHVCVNITGQTIGAAAAMTEIREALTAAGPDITDKILFEITETTALGSPEVAAKFSQDMREVGCRVALDDFGTGYGTFNELRHLKLDTLKIDLSFVQNMIENHGDERAVNTIAFVAQVYGLTTVAEGVETEATLHKLAELRVDRAQGYLFGKPAPVV
ncbi:MAG: EAL domain-containing protein [Mycobacterium sp.]|nr:EAL domain-containing protein [Mycobacterium sp.]